MSAKKAAKTAPAKPGPDRKITQQEADRLANSYDAMGDAIIGFVTTNFRSLSTTQIITLRDQASLCIARSMELTAQGARITINDAANNLATIYAATAKAKEVVTIIKNVGTAIDIATAVANLATAILSGDVTEIGKAIKGVVDEVGHLGDDTKGNET